MLYYLTAGGLILHTFFWGYGLAFLSLPRKWSRWGWCFVPGFGFALQSAAVWAGAHTSFAGTNSYAWGTESIPALLLIFSVWRRKPRLSRSVGWVAVAMIAIGCFFLAPMARPGAGLTSSSLGNCDQADYAAGARVFQEFSRDDRGGFMGQSEVTKVRSADYFFDFWVRLNHFTPSALIAHNASIFGVESFRLVSVTAAAVAILNLPIVFFLARLAVGMRGLWLFGFVVLYGVSPLNAYAIYHGQLGQLYAVQGIAMLTVAVLGAGRFAFEQKRAWAFLPLALAAFWLLAGSYNFILLVCLAPGAAWLLIRFWRPADWLRIARVIAVVATALGLCAALFWGRFDGLIERFSLFHQYDFGWAVPLFSPESLLGMFKDSRLNGWTLPVRTLLSIFAVVLWVGGLLSLMRRQRIAVVGAVALFVPILAGWSVLAWESRVRVNASYDAYKLVSVFFPGVLASFVCWLSAARDRGFKFKCLAGLALACSVWASLSRDEHFRRQIANPPLRVNRNVAELALLEKDPRFSSLNMLVDDYWTRLWANAFLLRKTQYFSIHTYEGRLNTALKGEWNLSDSLLRPIPVDPADFIQFNVRFFLVRANAPGLLRVSYLDGWYGEEHSGPRRWHWSNGRGRILVENPTGGPVRVQLRLLVQSFLARNLAVQVGDRLFPMQSLDGSNQVVEFEDFVLPPGQTILALTSDAVSPGTDDERLLSFALYGLELRALSLTK